MVEEMRDRYDRQKLISGWNQEKLDKGVVTIIGSDNLARYIALPLTALGVGNLRIIDTAQGNSGDLLIDMSLKGKSRVKNLEKALARINPRVEVTGIHSELSTKTAQYFLEGSDVIVEATNNSRSKSYSLDFCHDKKVPLISASSDYFRGKVFASLTPGTDPLFIMPMFDNQSQGDLVSMEIGGVVAEEVKKILMGDGESLLSRPYDYNPQSDERFYYRGDSAINGNGNFRDKKILMVGAGALGCFLGPAIVRNLKPKRFDVMDFDYVEEHNLNRQVCYYDSIGRQKAESLAEKLSKISRGKTEANPILGRFTQEFESEVGYDLILDAVDSFQAKSILHNYSMRKRLSLLSGGTNYRAATILTYVPGVTSCLNCQVNLDQLAMKAEIIRRTSCLQSPNPSVIMTNQIAGAIIAAECRRVLAPKVYGPPLQGEIKYIADFDSRGGVSRKNGICDCHTREIKSIELPDPMRVEVKDKETEQGIMQEIYLDGRRI
jgi:molybdopterin/thiamine biosynthesis adenylyltransferase